MRKTRFDLIGLCLVALPLFAGTAFAQDRDIRPVLDRLDRLERDLNQVQRQVYRNQVGGAPAPITPGVDGNAAIDVQNRMDQLEGQMRALTGQLEEIQYGISQLAGRFDKTQSDNDVRFQQIEGHGATASKANGGAGNMDQPASAAGNLSPPAGAAPAQAAAAGTGLLPSGSAQDQYNYAFGLLRQADYKNAEAAFKAFLQKHPTDPLAANAQYWLGETFFVRGDFSAATAAFAEGYQKYPQGPKASADLLKLGMSLGNQGRTKDACFSFARLERDFPKMEPSIKDTETQEKKKLGC
jgi:tol-pal system protein YbgF